MAEIKRARVNGYIKVPVDMLVYVEVNDDEFKTKREAESTAHDLFTDECGWHFSLGDTFEYETDGDSLGDEWTGQIYTEKGKILDGHDCELDIHFQGFVSEDEEL
jgi:hypothetical protein